MQKINIQIDVAKIDKSRIRKNTYTTKDGEEVTELLYDIDLVKLKPEKQKVISEGDTWKRVKTHFAVQGQTKEERDSQAESIFLGSGFSFVDKKEEYTEPKGIEYPEDDLDIDNIPF